MRWKAIEAMSTYEGMFPDPLKPLIGELEANASRAEAAYRNSIKEAKNSLTGGLSSPSYNFHNVI